MDLNNFKTNNEEWMTVCNISGEETDIEILIAGRDSEDYKKSSRRFAEARRKKAKGLKPAEEEQLTLELLAKCTKNWKNLEENGEKVEFSFENALDIYKRYEFVSEQILQFIIERENFLKN